MTRDEVFELCMYIAASAAELRNEPKIYGPLRLLEVLERMARRTSEEHGDTFLRHAARTAQSGKAILLDGEEAFYDLLDRMVLEFVREQGRRAGLSGGRNDEERL